MVGIVKKSYRTILKSPDGFKEKVIKILLDLDKRIKNITTIEELSTIFSKKDHTHDNSYSPIGHTHDERYSQINHTHNEYLTRLDMAEYAPYDHVHNNIMYITPFKISGGVSYVYCEIEPSNVLVLEDTQMEHFTIEDIQGRYITVRFNGEPTDKLYHLIYYQVTSEAQQNVFMQVQNITANRGDEVTLYSRITDINNAPINEGEVTYTMEGGTDG